MLSWDSSRKYRTGKFCTLNSDWFYVLIIYSTYFWPAFPFYNVWKHRDFDARIGISHLENSQVWQIQAVQSDAFVVIYKQFWEVISPHQVVLCLYVHQIWIAGCQWKTGSLELDFTGRRRIQNSVKHLRWSFLWE